MAKVVFNRALRILLATNGMILIAAAMLGPIYALFVDRIGGNLLDASFAGGVLALAAGITTMISGKLSDKVKENELIVVFGYVVVGLGFMLYALVNSIIFLLIVQVIVGIGEAIYSPAFDAIYSKHIDGGKSGEEWGMWESMNYFTTAIGAIIGGYIVTRFGFNMMFFLMAMLCLSSAFYIFRLPRKVL